MFLSLFSSSYSSIQLTSITLTECYVAREWFMGGSRLSRLDRLSSLDLSGSNRFDDFFLCDNCDVAFAQITRLERQYKAQRDQVLQQRHREGNNDRTRSERDIDIQDFIPTHELPDASTMFLLRFPNLTTLKLNRLYRLTGRGVKMLTSCYNEGGTRVSLRQRLIRLELIGDGLGEEGLWVDLLKRFVISCT